MVPTGEFTADEVEVFEEVEHYYNQLRHDRPEPGDELPLEEGEEEEAAEEEDEGLLEGEEEEAEDEVKAFWKAKRKKQRRRMS